MSVSAACESPIAETIEFREAGDRRTVAEDIARWIELG